MRLLFLSLLLAFAALPSSAGDVYKCAGANGKTVYQPRPCEDGGGKTGISTAPTLADIDVWELSAQRGVVMIGQSMAQVKKALHGPPDKVNDSFGGGKRRQQWVYQHRYDYGQDFYYFEDGVLTGWN